MQVGDYFALYSRHKGFLQITMITTIVGPDEDYLISDGHAETDCGLKLRTEKEDDRYYCLSTKEIWAMPATQEDFENDTCIDLLEWAEVEPRFDPEHLKVYLAHKDRLIAAREAIEAFKEDWAKGSTEKVAEPDLGTLLTKLSQLKDHIDNTLAKHGDMQIGYGVPAPLDMDPDFDRMAEHKFIPLSLVDFKVAYCDDRDYVKPFDVSVTPTDGRPVFCLIRF